MESLQKEKTGHELINHMDVLNVINSFLSRKQKFFLQQLNKDFRQIVVPSSMVSLVFYTTNSLTNSTLFSYCFLNFKKVEKLTFDEIVFDSDLVSLVTKVCSEEGSEKILGRVKELTISNLKFQGSSDVQSDFIAAKFFSTILKFQALEVWELKNIDRFPQIVNFLEKASDISFLKSLQKLSFEASLIDQEYQETVFIKINEIVSKFPNLEYLSLSGLRIGEHLGDLMKACKKPTLKRLNLSLNGIEPEFSILFQHIVNYEKLEEFDITANWIGCVGVERMKDMFRAFQTLKVLKMTNNKLFIDDHRRTEDLKDLLFGVVGTLEELYLNENSMKNEDVVIITPALAHMKRLRVLNLNKNPLNGSSIQHFLDEYSKKAEINELNLQELNVSHSALFNEGAKIILDRIQFLPKLKKLNIGACKVTDQIGGILIEFIRNFDANRSLQIDCKIQDHRKIFEAVKSDVRACLEEKDLEGNYKRKAYLQINL